MEQKQIFKDRLALVRAKLLEIGLDAIIVPQADPHASEYIADRWQSRRWLSGFTGSAGDLVVTLSDAALWADSRYWLQAGEQLAGTGVSVMEDGKPGVPSIVEYLAAAFPSGCKVGIDGTLVSVGRSEAMSSEFRSRGLDLCFIEDIFDSIWESRPELPVSPVFVHEEKYAGESAKSKISRLLAEVSDNGADALFVADLAEIAWILNVRGMDIECNPVVISYLYLSDAIKVWFVDERKLTSELRAYLASQGVMTAPYAVVGNFLANLLSGDKVMSDPARLPRSLGDILGARLVSESGSVEIFKACRNEAQIAGTREAMVCDGVAMVNAFYELDEKLDSGSEVTELDVADLLSCERSRQPGFVCLSFETVAGYADHGAVVHYTATPETASVLRRDNLLLVDSGATYLSGTTDITRTMSLGNPTAVQRRDFTLVLKGMIDLARAVFPKGTRGAQLDVLARAPMWREGAMYLHGTGHGVGHCLNVHEGPQSIRLQENPVPLMPGMLTSDEPGIYRAGEYGIRCENLILCVEAKELEGDFLEFETLTLYPFDAALVDTAMLDRWEIEWFNNYQQRVFDVLSPLLDSADKVEWLRGKCSLLDVNNQ